MAEKLFNWIVYNPKKIIMIYVIVIALSAIMYPFVAVNYSMSDYLPEEASSVKAMKLMAELFDDNTPNCRVMVKDISVAKALEIKDAIAGIDGINSVTWLDDRTSVNQPLAFIDDQYLDTYYKDGNALFSVSGDNDKRIEIIENIKLVITDCGVDAFDNSGRVAIGGDLASMAIATTSTRSEVPVIGTIAILFAIFILIFVTRSWIEPLIVMAGLGIAVVINSGTNLIFGGISFITNASGSLLQMAVSLDYSVFLIHRFEECKQIPEISTRDAMAMALTRSLSSIASSGLTTFTGFIALVFMSYRIGEDLGLALAKGILISLIVVFSFTPTIVLLLEPVIKKTVHKPLMPDFSRLAFFSEKIGKVCVVAFCILLVPAFLASQSNDYMFGASKIFGPDTSFGRDTIEINEQFGESDTYVLIVPRESKAKEQELSDALHKIDRVDSIISYADSVGIVIPEEYVKHMKPDEYAQLNSDDYTRFVIGVNASTESVETFNLVQEIRDVAETVYPGEAYLAGQGVSITDLKDIIELDFFRVNIIAVAAIFVILLINFKSISLPIILVLTIETAVWINTGLPYFLGDTVHVCSYLIISSIQLGATVDYAILFTDRYKENRQYLSKENSAFEMIKVCSPSILVSGTVLMVMGFLMFFISSHGIISQLGYFMGIGALLSMIMVIFVLPELLKLLDGIIQKTTLDINWYETEN